MRAYLQRRRASAAGGPPAVAKQVLGTVRGKLMRVVLLTTAIALSVTGLVMLSHELYIYRTTWTGDLSTEATILALAAAPALATDDRAAAERNLDALEPRRRVMAAALYSANGRLFASYVRAGEAPPPLAAPPEGIREPGEGVELVRLVRSNGEVVGSIYLRARYNIVGRLETYAGIFVLVTLLSLTVAFLLSQQLQKGITDPLDTMTAVAREIKNRGDYSLRARKISDDEIGVVVDAFNNMLDVVQSGSQALREADRRKDEFLATLAHELRNPLAPIRHAVKLLQLGRLDERQRRWAQDIISRQVQRMALMLDDLLDVSRITRGRLELKIVDVDLESLVDTAVETARPLIESKQQCLTVELPPPPVTLAVDPLRLSQSLSNLLTNASKYTDAGGQITLAAALAAHEITLSVRDTGIGFDADARPGLFEMFSQVDAAIARSEAGLGIGLALVKGLVGLHGGSVDAHSPGLGAGSTFTIRLPRPACESVAPPRAEPTAVPPPASRFKILVADDNRDAADSLAMLLQEGGHRLAVAHSGGEALQIAGRDLPQAIILDIGMPDINGYEVAQRIRTEPWGREIYLVAVTGWGQKEDKARATAAGFDHHLTKPVDPDVLERLLQAHVKTGIAAL